MDITEILKDVSIIIASFTAIYGIHSWRREYIGKRKIDLIEDVLVLFYEANDAIIQMRSIFGYQGEGSSRETTKPESPEEKQVRDNAYVIIERYQKHKELFSKLFALKYRFMAQFGPKYSKPFDEMRNILQQIFVSARQLSRLYARIDKPYRDENKKIKDYEKIEQAEDIFWDSGTEDDIIRSQINTAILQIENLAKKVIR